MEIQRILRFSLKKLQEKIVKMSVVRSFSDVLLTKV